MSPQQPRNAESATVVSADDSPTKTKTDQKLMLQKRLSSIEEGFAKFGRKLEEVIDNSPIGIKLDEQQLAAIARSHSPQRRNVRRNEHLEFYLSDSSFERSDSGVERAKEAAAVARKSAVAVGGGALIGVGVVMIPTLPPPFATLTMLGGYAVLGTEFEGPRKVVQGAREKLANSLVEDDDTKEGESQEDTDDEEWEDVGERSTKKNNKDRGIKRVAKSFGKSVILPALDKVCAAYERFEGEKGSQDKNDTSNDSSEEETTTSAANEVVTESDVEIVPAADEVVADNEEKVPPAANVVENEKPQAEDNFFDTDEDPPAIVQVKSDDWTDVEEDAGKEEPLADDGNKSDNDWDDAVLISHLDD